MNQLRSDMNEVKRSLARQLRAKGGFVGVGVGDDEIRLYAASETAPVVEYFRSQHGTTYRGYPVAVVLSPGFRADRPRSAL